jgi:hypothetical protein
VCGSPLRIVQAFGTNVAIAKSSLGAMKEVILKHHLHTHLGLSREGPEASVNVSVTPTTEFYSVGGICSSPQVGSPGLGCSVMHPGSSVLYTWEARGQESIRKDQRRDSSVGRQNHSRDSDSSRETLTVHISHVPTGCSERCMHYDMLSITVLG